MKFVGLSVILLPLVASYQVKIRILKFNHTLEEVRAGGTPTQYYNPPWSNSPFECTHIGRYPDPFGCRSYYVCSKYSGKHCEGTGNNFKEDIGCIFASKWCTCPNGTFWAGPSVGCIDDSKDMEACCNFKPDCVNGNGGDFGQCSLSSLGYKYSCRLKENRPIIHVEMDTDNEMDSNSRGIRSTEDPSKLKDIDLQTNKVMPVCGPVMYVFDERYDNVSHTTSVLVLDNKGES